MGSPRPEARRRVLVLFALAALVIPVQELIRLKVAEPFPALFFPSFGSVPDDGETYRVDVATLRVADAAGRVTSRPATDLTRDAGVLPDSVLRLLAYAGLDERGRPVTLGRRGALERALLGQHLGRDRDDRTALVDTPEVRAWMRDRIAVLFPGSAVAEARIVWTRRQIDRESHDVRSQRTLKTIPVIPR